MYNTSQEIIELVELFKLQSAQILTEWAFTKEVHWQIKNIQPGILVELSKHYNVKWFNSGDQMAIILWAFPGGWHISLRSVPVEIKETMEYIPIIPTT